jgi:hypothetical protein
MTISIKSLEAERLAREIAARTGESLTGAIQKPWKNVWNDSSANAEVRSSPIS